MIEESLDLPNHNEPDRRNCGESCVAFIKLRTTVKLLIAVVILDLVFNASPLIFAKDVINQVNKNAQTIENHDEQIIDMHKDLKELVRDFNDLNGYIRGALPTLKRGNTNVD